MVSVCLLTVTLFRFGGASGTDSSKQYPLDLSGVGQHEHNLKMVSADEAPSVDIRVLEDSEMAGQYNIRIQTENFSFTPESVGSEHVLGEGYAKVFVDDVRISRAYGSWYHLPRLEPGEHIIKVTLNTNDHQEYATDENFLFDTETITVSDEADHADSEPHGSTTTH